jgi:hypothetical protein
MAQRGGKRAGAGRPAGSRNVRQITRWAAAKAEGQTVLEAMADRALEELAVVGFSDIGDYVDARGTLVPMNQIEPNKRRALASLKTSRYNKPGAKDGVQEDALEIRLWPKLDALQNILRAAGRFHDKLEVSDTRPLRDKVAKARARLAAAKRA